MLGEMTGQRVVEGVAGDVVEPSTVLILRGGTDTEVQRRADGRLALRAATGEGQADRPSANALFRSAACRGRFLKIAFRSERSRPFASRYAGLSGRGDVPARSALRPETMLGILSSFVIREVEGPGVVRFRLAGTRGVDRYGFEVTGRNDVDFVPQARRKAAFGAFRTMDGQPCAMYALIRSRSAAGRASRNEAIGFPFRSDRTGRIHLVFQSNDVEVDPRRDLASDPLAAHPTVLDRRFIDVGFGAPEVP
jgi:hypothetical protein